MFDEKEVDVICGAIAHRRSMGVARVHPEQPVDRRLIERVLEVADWAPSHGETEPWRFSVYTGDSRIALGQAFADAYREEAGADFKPETYESQKKRSFAAPVWISIGMSPELRSDGTLRMTEEEEVIAVGCAVQNLHIVANAQGLGGMWLSKGVFRHPRVAEFVGLKAPERLLGFFFLGYPNIPWPAGERRPLAEKVRWID